MRGFPFAIMIVLFATALVPALPHSWAASPTLRYEVAGKVVSDNGTPLAKVQVNGYVSNDQSGWSDAATTDPDGTFVLLLPAGEGNVNVFDPSFGASDSKSVSVHGNVTGLTFTLPSPPPRTAIVKGHVLGPDGPIAGATVSLGMSCCVPWASPPTADAAGSSGAEATATPAVAPAAGNDSSTPTTTSAPMMVPYRPWYGGGYVQPVVTGADGAYTLATYAGSYQITADAKGFAQTTERVEAKEGQTVTQDLKLEHIPAADAVVKGHVVDASTGAPIAHAQVSISNLAWGQSNWTTTDATGAFQAMTLPGWTQITVSADGYAPTPIAMGADVVASPPPDVSVTKAPATPTAPTQAPLSYYQGIKSLALVSGANAADFSLAPKTPATVALVGYVVDHAAKSGVEGAWVNVWNQDTGEWGNAQTDKTGSYKVLVRPGHYTINAYADGYLSGADAFVIPAGAAQAREDVTIFKGTPRYAPCDEGCGGGVRYGASPMMADQAPAPAHGEAPAPTPTQAAPTASLAMGPGRAANAPTGGAVAPSQGGAQVYHGEGGGLPPYSESAAATAPSGGAASSPRATPAPALALTLGVLALLAVAYARRR